MSNILLCVFIVIIAVLLSIFSKSIVYTGAILILSGFLIYSILPSKGT